jgi:hypothetical protein
MLPGFSAFQNDHAKFAALAGEFVEKLKHYG